ncbi:hypothetical protein RUND412_007667 [Rhizina undulata]
MTSKADPLSPPTTPDDRNLADGTAAAKGPFTSSGADQEASSHRSSLSGEDRTANTPSSPPTSVVTPLKESSSTEQAGSSPVQRDGQRESSTESDGSTSARRGQFDADVQALSDLESDEDHEDEEREGSVLRTSYHPATVESEEDDENDAPRSSFRRPAHVPKNWETTSSQWEDEEAADALPHASPRRSTVSQKSPPYVPPIYPARSRPNNAVANSPKTHLQPHRHRSPMSRASSASYDTEKKAPLVLLHVTLLVIPGADEELYSFLTPTIVERGVLVEHPRGDHHLLEELILDALGIDEEYEEDEEDETHQSWEQSLGVPKPAHRKKWEVRVYASNGLMTAGAWRRVWGEMERIDVEIWPRNRRLANIIAARPKSASSMFSGIGKDGKINGSIRSRRSTIAQPSTLSLRPSSPLPANSLLPPFSAKEENSPLNFSFFTSKEASKSFHQLPLWLKVVGVANVAFFTYFTLFQLLGLSMSFNPLGSRSVALQEVKVSFGSELANVASPATVSEDIDAAVEAVELADGTIDPVPTSEDIENESSTEVKIEVDADQSASEAATVDSSDAEFSEAAFEGYEPVQIPLLPQNFDSEDTTSADAEGTNLSVESNDEDEFAKYSGLEDDAQPEITATVTGQKAKRWPWNYN